MDTEQVQSDITELKKLISKLTIQLDTLSELLATINTKPLDITEELKENIKEYMMSHYNIKWVDDEMEENVYEVILTTIFSTLKKIC